MHIYYIIYTDQFSKGVNKTLLHTVFFFFFHPLCNSPRRRNRFSRVFLFFVVD